MAGQMAHMEVAYKLAERIGIDEYKAEFILGSIAPDSVHFEEDYLDKKIHSHIFENCGPWGDTQDYDQWISNIKSFWNKYVVNEKEKKRRAFLIGICVHCLTDYWNDLLIWRALQKKMIPPMTYDGFKEEYYPESRRIDKWLYQYSSKKEELFGLLEEAEEMDFEDYVTAKNQIAMKKHLVNTQYNLSETIDVSGHKYFTSEMILWFLDETADRIYNQLLSFVTASI
ncbi:zinc dependent phospholipase C family protein [Butyrivibrio sp. AC2005]|uniref:zinc dependent phospholipase C family protein n=1 Tax=Butyrivibrio sp. AC2005 TaxID=1280672 RepID=UPI00041C5D88|nr:zinc dependent phospholipase C family protein [Butyrivibrio sp. AC2005]